MKAIGEAATPAARYQDALDDLKNAVIGFARPFEEAITTLARIRVLVPAIPEAMLTESGTAELRNLVATLRGKMRRQSDSPITEFAASLLRTERKVRDLIERGG